MFGFFPFFDFICNCTKHFEILTFLKNELLEIHQACFIQMTDSKTELLF